MKTPYIWLDDQLSTLKERIRTREITRQNTLQALKFIVEIGFKRSFIGVYRVQSESGRVAKILEDPHLLELKEDHVIDLLSDEQKRVVNYIIDANLKLTQLVSSGIKDVKVVIEQYARAGLFSSTEDEIEEGNILGKIMDALSFSNDEVHYFMLRSLQSSSKRGVFSAAKLLSTRLGDEFDPVLEEISFCAHISFNKQIEWPAISLLSFYCEMRDVRYSVAIEEWKEKGENVETADLKSITEKKEEKTSFDPKGENTLGIGDIEYAERTAGVGGRSGEAEVIDAHTEEEKEKKREKERVIVETSCAAREVLDFYDRVMEDVNTERLFLKKMHEIIMNPKELTPVSKRLILKYFFSNIAVRNFLFPNESFNLSAVCPVSVGSEPLYLAKLEKRLSEITSVPRYAGRAPCRR